MVRSPLTLRALLAVLALAILAMPVSGAHLHLCFDGTEPPATLHLLEDGAHHSGEGMRPAHQDIDVSLESRAHAKKSDRSLPILGVIAVFLQFSRSNVVLAALPRERDAFLVPASVFRILPPLRAPPV